MYIFLLYPEYPGYNCYVLLSLSCLLLPTSTAPGSNTVVSKTLIVKDNVGLLPEDELASHYCLQVPGWCPCVNCRDFSPPSVSLLAKDNAKDDLCDMNRESYRLITAPDVEAKGKCYN